MGKYNILLVDDEITSLNSLERALRRDYQVFSVTNGEDALVIMEKEEINLIISDHRMPGMTGLELLEKVMQQYPDTIRIILTAYADQSLLMDAINTTRVHSFINKPWTPEHIKSVVSKWEAVSKLEESEAKRRLTEKALKESEEKYRLLVENANEVIIVAQNGRIKFANPKATEITGYSREELTSKPFVEFIHPDDRNLVLERHLKRIREENLPSIYAFRIIDKNGNTKWIEINAVVIDWEGQHATLNFMSDITERRHAEKKLVEERASLAQRVKERTAELIKANTELAKASRLKDEFIANMSHELRTPLNAILGISEGLQEGIYGSVNNKQINHLQSIVKYGHHLLNLINDILEVAKIDAGKLALDIQPVSIKSVCSACLQSIGQKALEKNLQISSNLDGTITNFQASQRCLKEILMRLLNNAVKFTPEGGSIGIEVVGDRERGMVHFTVWDTGIGISEDDMELLFQPFVQLDGGLSRSYPGTGLGLTLVNKLTELHEGSVSVESKLNQGSRFTVSLPWNVT
jgi:PAS domain S-box-containing protein